MTEKINKKYGSELSKSQKEIIRNYALYSENQKDKLVEFLKERKAQAMSLLEDFEEKEQNKILIGKVDHVRTRINELRVDDINDDAIVKFLTITKLISEMSKSE